MTNKLIQKFEQKQIKKILGDRKIPEFRAGDTLKIGVKIIEGSNERLQYFQGLCIARSNNAINSTFTVRKISNNEGVERKFPLYSPKTASIEVVKRGVVRRAKLYYMRELKGKAARIKEKKDYSLMKSTKKAPKVEKKVEITTVSEDK